jgi:hypothetical protein
MSYPKSSLTDLTVALNPSSYRILSGYLVALFLIGALLSALPLVLHWQRLLRLAFLTQVWTFPRIYSLARSLAPIHQPPLSLRLAPLPAYV